MYQNYAIVLESYMITEESFGTSKIGSAFRNFGEMINRFLRNILDRIREFFAKYIRHDYYIHKAGNQIYQDQLSKLMHLASAKMCRDIIENSAREKFAQFKEKFENAKEMTTRIREAIMKAPDKKNYINSAGKGSTVKSCCDSVVSEIKMVQDAIDPGTDMETIPMYTGEVLTMLSEMINIALRNYAMLLWKGNKEATTVELGNISAHKM